MNFLISLIFESFSLAQYCWCVLLVSLTASYTPVLLRCISSSFAPCLSTPRCRHLPFPFRSPYFEKFRSNFSLWFPGCHLSFFVVFLRLFLCILGGNSPAYLSILRGSVLLCGPNIMKERQHGKYCRQ